MLKFKKQIAFTFLKSWVFFPINRVGIISFFIDIKGRISGCVGGDVCEWFVFGVEVGLGVFIILDNTMFKHLFTNANNKEMSVYTSKILLVS